MRMKYVSRIQASVKSFQKIGSRRASASVLDGSYRSMYKGRSMNFDELREYVPGDDIKDVDWNASARSRKLYVRQYIAEKKHNILFIFDTNVTMLADSEGIEPKSDLALMSAGILAYYVNRNGDFISSIYATENSVNFLPFQTGLENIELMLERYDKELAKGNRTDINAAIDHVVRNIRKKMIVVLVTDINGINSITEKNLKRLIVANDVLVLNISDLDFQDRSLFDVTKNEYIPEFFSSNKKLINSMKEKKQKMQKDCMEKLKKYGIPCCTIDYLEELDLEIMNLLSLHRMEKTKR